MSEEQQSQSQALLAPLYQWLISTRASDPDRQRRGHLAAVILVIVFVLTVVALVTGLIGSGTSAILLGAGLTVVWAAIYLVNRRGWTDAAGVAMAGVVLVVNLVLIEDEGPLSAAATPLVLPVILAGLIGPSFSAAGLAAVAGIAYLVLNLRADPAYFRSMAEGGPALQSLLVYMNLVIVGTAGSLYSRLTRRALQESQEMSLALAEERAVTLARLEAQTRHLQATIRVARAIVGGRDLNTLLEDTVRLVHDTFGYYHVQVFLVDETQGYAVLQQSTGEVGRQLLAAGHQLPVGSLSVIGQATASGRPVIARDTDQDAVHRRNELLPNTRSEMALPLTVGSDVIGALDLQSVEPDAFEADVIPTLQALADQLAIAIQNARLFEQAQDNLRELREMSRDVAHRSWEEFLAEAREEDVRQVYGPEAPGLQVQRSRVVERVLASGSVLISTGVDGQPVFLAVPVVVRNQVVGVLGVEPDGDREWTRQDLQIMQGIAERTALAVENARLYLQAQRAAERERMITSIADRLQRAPSLARLLENAAEELAVALGTDHVYAEISVGQPVAERRRPVQDAQEGAEVIASSEGQEPAATDSHEEARADL
jgi:GAF domain-containing protein